MTIEAFDIAIDVSHYQGAIDWPAVAGAGIRIALIKASEGAAAADPNFAANHDGAAAAGIAAIAYHYLTADAGADQIAQFRRAAGLGPGTPFALDWEGRASQTCSAAAAEAVGAALAALTGRVPLGYWGLPGASPAMPSEAMLGWDRWVPRYPVSGVAEWASLPASVKAQVLVRWAPDHVAGARADRLRLAQYSCWGKVPGITGPVDRSVALFDSADAAVAWASAGVAPVA